MKETLHGNGWSDCFGVCDRLLQQLEPFDEAIELAEYQLGSLSLLELWAYSAFGDVDGDLAGWDWTLYERLILCKLGMFIT